MIESRSQAEDLVRRHLATAYGPERDRREHLKTYSPAALVLVGGELVVQRDLDPAVYAASSVTDEGPLPRPAGYAFDVEAVGAFANDACGWALECILSERSTGLSFQGMFAGDSGGILGGGVLELSELPGPAIAVGIALAELGRARRQGGGRFASGLELSFARAFQPVNLPLRYLPESRFSCQGCGECCHAGKWGISLSVPLKQALASLPFAQLWPDRLPQAPDFEQQEGARGRGRLAAAADGYCAFHDTRAGCLLHGTLGQQPVPACHTYPFFFTRTPDGIDVWTSFACHSALYGLGRPFALREGDIRSRYWADPADQRQMVVEVGEQLFLGSPEQPIPWEVYRAIEGKLLELLEPGSPVPLTERLEAGERALQGLSKRYHPGLGPEEAAFVLAAEIERPVAAPAPGGEDDLVLEVLCLFLVTRIPPAELPEFLGGGFAAMAGELVRHPGDLAGPPDLIVRYLRRCLFHKMFLAEAGVLFTWRYVLLSYATLRLYTRHLVLREAAAGSKERASLGSPGWGEIGSSALVLPTVPAAIPETPGLAVLQKGIQDLESFVIHSAELFKTSFVRRDGQRDRLVAPEVARSLIWG